MVSTAAAAAPAPAPSPAPASTPSPRCSQRLKRIKNGLVQPIRAAGNRLRQAVVPEEEVDDQEPDTTPARRVQNRPHADQVDTDNDPLAPFDRDDFAKAMAAEQLMDSPDPDDINVSSVDDGEIDNESEPSGSEVGDSDSLDSDDEIDDWGTEDAEDASYLESEHVAEATQGYVPKNVLETLAKHGWTTYNSDESRSFAHAAASDYYSGPSGPTKSAVAFAESPLGMFFYFLPKSLWVYIADMCNRYRAQQLPRIAEERHAKLLAKKAINAAYKVKDVTEILDELKSSQPIEAHEILHYLGLLIARVLSPHRDGLRRHWSTVPDGATPAGTFGRFMKRKRFEEISRFLHFNDNSVEQAGKRDRAVKIRPVLQVLEKTFRRGFRLGARISFDEGMIPNRSRFNPVRVYMAAKPNKWGTKFFLTCCAETAYCSRVEVYCGAEETINKSRRKKGEPKIDDPSTISAMVIRNITKALKGLPAKRLIVTDNYYSSVSLALKLLSLGFYTVGTVRTNRLGWCRDITYQQKTRPKSIPRGTYRIATASIPSISLEAPATSTSVALASAPDPAPAAAAAEKKRATATTPAPAPAAAKKRRVSAKTAAQVSTVVSTPAASGEMSAATPAPAPDLVAVSWMDSKPVNFLATGCATTLTSVERKEKDGSKTTVPCPQLIVDYHKGMGGVDVHDQLRLQRYSIQKCVRFKKYYKALFLGLVDMALINGYIVHKIALKRANKKPATHADYMSQLHKSLLALTNVDLTTDLNAVNLIATPTPPSNHGLLQIAEMYAGGGHPKRRQYRCKVCAAFNTAKKTCFETSWYCQSCSDHVGGLVSLCDRARRKEEGNTLTCSEVWHKTWVNGTAIPADLRRKIRFRKHNTGDGDHDERKEQDED